MGAQNGAVGQHSALFTLGETHLALGAALAPCVMLAVGHGRFPYAKLLLFCRGFHQQLLTILGALTHPAFQLGEQQVLTFGEQ